MVRMFVIVDKLNEVFRCEEHLYKRLRWSVGRSVRPSVPHDAITWKTRKTWKTRLLREEEEEEETDYVAIPLRRDSFAPRDLAIPLFLE
jgi:hypothetical protein